jgi:hypothetical protein
MKLRVLAVLCAALLVAPAAFAEVSATMDLVGDVETNTTLNAKDDGSDSVMSWGNDGRTKLKFGGTIEGDNGWYAKGEGDGEFKTSGDVEAADYYIELGTESFAFKIGRYELAGQFGKGQDIFIAEAPGTPGRYEGKFFRGRHSDYNNMALIFGDFQLGLVVGSASADGTIAYDDGTTEDVSFGTNVYAIRPAFTMSTDAFKLKANVEFGTYMPQNSDNNDYTMSKMGGATNIEFAAGESTVGASFAYGMVTGDNMDGSDMGDDSTMSAFGYYTMPVGDNSFGLGGGFTMESVDDADDTMFETFASFNQQLPVEGLWVKYGASFAGASFDAGDDTTAFGARVRFNYAF